LISVVCMPEVVPPTSTAATSNLVKWGTPTLIPNTDEYSLRYSLVQMRSSSLMIVASEKDILNSIKMILSSLKY